MFIYLSSCNLDVPKFHARSTKEHDKISAAHIQNFQANLQSQDQMLSRLSCRGEKIMSGAKQRTIRVVRPTRRKSLTGLPKCFQRASIGILSSCMVSDVK